MLHALQAFGSAHRFTIDVVDVDADPKLVALYDELVPVLTAAKDDAPAVQLCHFFLDEARLRAFFED